MHQRAPRQHRYHPLQQPHLPSWWYRVEQIPQRHLHFNGWHENHFPGVLQVRMIHHISERKWNGLVVFCANIYSLDSGLPRVDSKNYGITIKETDQPLLLHRPKERLKPGGKVKLSSPSIFTQYMRVNIKNWYKHGNMYTICWHSNDVSQGRDQSMSLEILNNICSFLISISNSILNIWGNLLFCICHQRSGMCKRCQLDGGGITVKTDNPLRFWIVAILGGEVSLDIIKRS